MMHTKGLEKEAFPTGDHGHRKPDRDDTVSDDIRAEYRGMAATKIL